MKFRIIVLSDSAESPGYTLHHLTLTSCLILPWLHCLLARVVRNKRINITVWSNSHCNSNTTFTTTKQAHTQSHNTHINTLNASGTSDKLITHKYICCFSAMYLYTSWPHLLGFLLVLLYLHCLSPLVQILLLTERQCPCSPPPLNHPCKNRVGSGPNLVPQVVPGWLPTAVPQASLQVWGLWSWQLRVAIVHKRLTTHGNYCANTNTFTHILTHTGPHVPAA